MFYSDNSKMIRDALRTITIIGNSDSNTMAPEIENNVVRFTYTQVVDGETICVVKLFACHDDITHYVNRMIDRRSDRYAHKLVIMKIETVPMHSHEAFARGLVAIGTEYMSRRSLSQFSVSTCLNQLVFPVDVIRSTNPEYKAA